MDAPNAVWTADFKGEFKTRDGVYCYPLTVCDGYSRALLACRGLPRRARAARGPCSSACSASTGCPARIRTRQRRPVRDHRPGPALGAERVVAAARASCPT
jgi:hypothetical protein